MPAFPVSINRFILKNEPDTALNYLTLFSRLIRVVLMNSQKSLIPLEDELEMLTIYLDTGVIFSPAFIQPHSHFIHENLPSYILTGGSYCRGLVL